MIDSKLTGGKIKNECMKKGITVKHIQKMLNIGAFQSVYDWFSGKSLPTLENFYELSKLLNVSMERLIVEKGARCLNYDVLVAELSLLLECSKYSKIHLRKYTTKLNPKQKTTG